MLVVPAEWPGARSAVLELLTRARAAENQCWALSCNRAGSIAFDGEDVAFPGTALLADPNDIEAWREKVVLASEDPELRERLGSNARNAFLEAYTWQKRARSILDDVKESLSP